jgi:hypothetical protein
MEHNFQSSPTFIGVGAGSYTVTVISSTPGACQTTGNVDINAPANAPTVTTSSTDPTCGDRLQEVLLLLHRLAQSILILLTEQTSSLHQPLLVSVLVVIL